MRHETRQSWRDAAKANVNTLLVAVVVGVGLIIGADQLPFPAWNRGFLVGFCSALLLMVLAVSVHTAAGTRNSFVGGFGEQASASALLTRRRRRQGWRIINGLRFTGLGDVDHVFVGPGGIYVVETKWTSVPWSVNGDTLCGPSGRDPLAQARSGARKIEHMLRFAPETLDVSVYPVLLVWGPGAPELDGGWCRAGGVDVLEGRRARRWRGTFARADLGPQLVGEITDRLLAFQSRQVAHDVKAGQPKPTDPQRRRRGLVRFRRHPLTPST